MYKNDGGLPVAGSLIVNFYIGQGHEWHKIHYHTLYVTAQRLYYMLFFDGQEK